MRVSSVVAKATAYGLRKTKTFLAQLKAKRKK